MFGHKAKLNWNLRGGTTPMLEGVDPSTLPWNHSSLLYLAPLPKGMGEVMVDNVTGEIIRARPSPRCLPRLRVYLTRPKVTSRMAGRSRRLWRERRATRMKTTTMTSPSSPKSRRRMRWTCGGSAR